MYIWHIYTHTYICVKYKTWMRSCLIFFTHSFICLRVAQWRLSINPDLELVFKSSLSWTRPRMAAATASAAHIDFWSVLGSPKLIDLAPGRCKMNVTVVTTGRPRSARSERSMSRPLVSDTSHNVWSSKQQWMIPCYGYVMLVIDELWFLINYRASLICVVCVCLWTKRLQNGGFATDPPSDWAMQDLSADARGWKLAKRRCSRMASLWVTKSHVVFNHFACTQTTCHPNKLHVFATQFNLSETDWAFFTVSSALTKHNGKEKRTPLQVFPLHWSPWRTQVCSQTLHFFKRFPAAICSSEILSDAFHTALIIAIQNQNLLGPLWMI